MNRTTLDAIIDRLAEARKARLTRRALAGHSDHMLRDIGVGRDARGRIFRLDDQAR